MEHVKTSPSTQALKENWLLIIELGVKWKFIKTRRKYKMEKELQKIELKNEFKSVKLKGKPSIYGYN